MKKHKNQKRKARRKRRKWSEEFKITLVVEFLKGEQTMTEIGAPHELDAAQISQWVRRYSNKGELLPFAKAELGLSKDLANQGEIHRDMDDVVKLQAALEHEKLRNMALEALIEAAEEATGREIRKKTGPGQ